MKSLNLLFIGVAMVCHHGFCQQPLLSMEMVDSFITKTMSDWHTMGIAVGIIKKDSVLLVKGYGYRDFAGKLPVTGQTIFPIASCSKTFTSALLGIAANEKKIQLDKPVNHYFPKFQLYTEKLTQQATIEDLLSHRTGLAGHDWAWTFNTNFPEDVYLKRIKYLEPFAALGTKFQYSNFMYFALSALSAKLYSKSWSDIVKEKFFETMEMNNSYGSFTSLKKKENIALSYQYKDSFQLKKSNQMDDLMGAASINSTASDLIHWLQMWINGGTYKNKQILTPQFVKKAISSQIVVYHGLSNQFPDEHFMNMGLSWFLSSYRGHYKANHTGNIDGFSSSITFFPYDSLGIVVLTNQNNSPLINLVPVFIADLFFNLPIRDKNSIMLASQNKDSGKPMVATIINIDTITKKPAFALSRYTGHFQNPGYGLIKIENYKKALLLTYYDLKLVLLPKGGNSFSSHYFEEGEIETDGVGDVVFNLDKTGIHSFHIPFEPAVKNIVFRRQ